jgi:hypothetical protein
VIPGIIASGQMVDGVDVFNQPWDEIARQETIASGELTLSGLTLTDYMAVQLLVNGVTVTTDDSTVGLTILIAGSEITSGYAWGLQRTSFSVGGTARGSTSDSAIRLTSTTATQGVGNASTESFSAVVYLHHPTSALHKKAFYRSAWVQPAGTDMEVSVGGGQLANNGAITGFVIAGSSDLTAGNMILLGVA